MKKILLACLISTGFTAVSSAQMVEYRFPGVLSPASIEFFVSASDVIAGTGLADPGGGAFPPGCTGQGDEAYSQDGWTEVDEASALANGDYLEVTITDIGGGGLEIFDISFSAISSANGPTAYAVYIDGALQSVGSFTGGCDIIFSTVPAPVVIPQNGSTIVRIVAFGATSPTGTLDFDGLIIEGISANLPIELSYFNAKLVGNDVVLNWRTETEEHNAYMAVERSFDGIKFSEIGRLKGAGTTVEPQEYKFIDTAPKAGLNYYRLRQVDVDGTVAYHKMVSVNVAVKDIGLAVFPTLAAETALVQTNRVAEVEGRLRIVDMMGKVMIEHVLAPGVNQVELQLGTLAPGQYIVQVQVADEISTARFVKQ